MNFKFENLVYNHNKSFQENLYSSGLKNFPDEPRFRCSQVVESICVYNQSSSTRPLNIYDSIDTTPTNYIISTAVAYCPEDWTPYDVNGNQSSTVSLFALLSDVYLTDLQNGKALLLIDQSVEGYHRIWLWKCLHTECANYNISPAAIIYATGDQSAEDQYVQWYTQSKLTTPRLKVVPSISLSLYIYQTYMISNLNVTFDNIIEYKTDKLLDIKLYDCTNLRFRLHRILNFLHLVNADLIEHGKLSMGDKTQWPAIKDSQFTEYNLPLNILDKIGDITPMWIDDQDPNTTGQYHQYITRILDHLYLSTWVSLVVESSFFDYEHSVFISEKTFKPIACMQPFIIVGSKHTLKYLKKLGYKTFDGFIDESYDDCNDSDRFLAIIHALKKIQSIPDKLSWLTGMREILEHNHRVFLEIGSKQSIEHIEISKYYSDYFKK
jgi:hypothetical protein